MSETRIIIFNFAKEEELKLSVEDPKQVFEEIMANKTGWLELDGRLINLSAINHVRVVKPSVVAPNKRRNVQSSI